MQYKYWFPAIVATLLLGGGAGSAPAQNASGLRGLFGAPAPGPAELAWRKVPRNEVGCIERGLTQQRTNVQSLIQSGVMPTDPRIGQLRATCHAQAVPPVAQPAAAPTSPYVVDRLALGGRLQTDGAAYREYQCAPSEQFQGLTWCQKQRQDKKPGAIAYSNSILHGQDGAAVYLNRSVAPATFERGEIDKEIEKLSTKYGERARVMRMPATAGVDGTAVIAQWGKIELEPLSAEELAELATAKDVMQGLRVDYLGDFTRSAKLGLPVYRIAGGAGFVWTAGADQKGRGHLRFLASDASAYGPAPAQPPAGPEVAQVKPDMPEQAAIVGAARANPEAGDTAPRTVTEAPGAKVEAASKAASDEVAPGPPKPGPETAIAEQPGADADAARVPSEPSQAGTKWPLFASIGGLVVVAAGAAVLLLMRRKPKEASQFQPPKLVAEPSYRFDSEALATGVLAERIAEADHTEDFEALVARAVGDAAPAAPQAVSTKNIDPGAERCTACGHEVESPAKFCSNCGTPVSQSAAE